jgi:anti-sigma factor RsiW
MSPPTTCREIAEFLADYLDRELPAERQSEFERHLSHCGCCEHYLESYRDTIRLCRESLRAGEPAEPLPPAPEQLVSAVMAALGKHKCG